MLRLHQLPLALDEGPRLDGALLRSLCAKRLRLSENRLEAVTLVKRSLDARDKGNVHFALTADVALTGGAKAEKAIAAKEKPNEVAYLEKGNGADPAQPLVGAPWPGQGPRPLVVGAGPAGLFCAYALARRGARPILIERGQPVQGVDGSDGGIEAEGRVERQNRKDQFLPLCSPAIIVIKRKGVRKRGQ